MYQTPYELHPDRRRDESVACLFTTNRYWFLIPVPPSLRQFSPGGKGPVAEGRGVVRARSMGRSRLRAKHRPPAQLISLAESCRHLEPAVKPTEQRGAILQPAGVLGVAGREPQGNRVSWLRVRTGLPQATTSLFLRWWQGRARSYQKLWLWCSGTITKNSFTYRDTKSALPAPLWGLKPIPGIAAESVRAFVWRGELEAKRGKNQNTMISSFAASSFVCASGLNEVADGN